MVIRECVTEHQNRASASAVDCMNIFYSNKLLQSFIRPLKLGTSISSCILFRYHISA